MIDKRSLGALIATFLFIAVMILFVSQDSESPVTGMVTYMPTVHDVIVNDSGFFPDVLEVSPDDTVRWNIVSGEHIIVDVGGSYSSDVLYSGQAYEVIFSEDGTYYYQDKIGRFFGEVRVS